MQLTTANIQSVTKVALDETAAQNIWIPAVIQEIQTRCNRAFTDDDAYKPTGSKSNWIRGEIPVGVVDGVNTIFTLAQTPDPTKIEVYRDGQLIFNEVDYTLTNRQLDFVEPPLAGSQITLSVNYLPLGLPDDEETTNVPEFPPDLDVAACWRTVILAQENPAATLTAQNDADVKSETTGSLKVEYFENAVAKRQEIASNWDKIIKRYRIPAICDSSRTQSACTALG